MSYVTVEVKISDGKIIPLEPGRLPVEGSGLLTILSGPPEKEPQSGKHRVQLPLIKGNGEHLINPTREELDASTWGD